MTDLVGNPSFESGTAGWNTSSSSTGMTLMQAAGGHSGAWAALLSNGGAAGGTCVLNDAPNWVTTTSAGRYTASLWVRADAPGVTLKLKLREYRKDSGVLIGSASSATVLSTQWQQISVGYSAGAAGASTLDYSASVANAAAGVCFEADDASLVLDPPPGAALSVTPAAGVAPLVVLADASASTPTELPLASYSFDFGDGSARVGPQPVATADHSYAAAGTYTVTVTVTDSAGAAATAQDQVTVSPGIVGNPSFESGTTGWNTSGSSPAMVLTQVAGGHSGAQAVQVSEPPGSGGANGGATCALNDSPNWVATTASGRYTASLWVRSAGQNTGRTLTLRLREYRKDTGASVGSARATVDLTTEWQRLSVAYAPLAPGASTLDYSASIDNADAVDGACFLADDAAVAFEPAPTAALSVTPATGTAPLSVQADASASAGSTGATVASYSFDFGDGSTPVGPQTEPTAGHAYTFSGIYTVTVTVTDSAGRAATATRTVTATGGIVTNSSFESGSAGWNTNGIAGATISRVADGHSGDWAARLANTSGGGRCALNDSPNWVTTTAAGLYTASLWVRSDAAAVGVKLELQESAGGWVGDAYKLITLTKGWQQVSVSYAPVLPGRSTLDLTATATSDSSGICFDADDAEIVFHPGPTAALTVAPATGVAPVSVQADASASAATDLPIASYSFNFGDGILAGPQTQPTATHSYAAAGTYTVTVTVADTRGGTSIARSQVTVAPGLIANPSFTQDVTGWNTSGSSSGVTLTRYIDGHSLGWSARLTNGATAAATCALNDAPNWIATTAAGTYTASLWVRSITGSATVKLKLREYRKDTGAFVGAASSTIVLTTPWAWQQVAVAYTPLAPGASTLDYAASSDNIPAGMPCFDADDAAIGFEAATAR